MTLQVLSSFSNLLDYFPAVYNGNPLNLLFLDDAYKIDNPKQFLRSTDSLVLMDEQREYFCAEDFNEGQRLPFPSFFVDQRPNPKELSEVLFQKFDIAGKLIFSQSDIAECTVNLAKKNKPQVVVLILVDGLSYYDLPVQGGMEPCFVPGVSITNFGFRTIIGKPSLSTRLFFNGYKKQKAFSLFDPSNELSSNIHDGFSETQFSRIREVAEIFNYFKRFRPTYDYVQIVLGGLDSLCHNHHGVPPIEFYVSEIFACLDEVETILSNRKISYQIHLVSDHGILWQNAYENFSVINDLLPEDANSKRYVKGAFNRMYGHITSGLGSTYTLFKAPYLSGKFRNNEWGVHGGISAWESIVPFITRVG